MNLMTDEARITQGKRNPSELRDIFGQNLRTLSARAKSVSQLCRDLGINRTQFNRYLSGESFPRPDVLYRICDFFNVDARILLEPVEMIGPGADTLVDTDEFRDFIGTKAQLLPEAEFPSGFYRFARPSFMQEGAFVTGLVRVYRKNGFTFVRGLEAVAPLRQQGLAIDRHTREFRGLVQPENGGVTFHVNRRGATTGTFNFLSRAPSFENNFWSGFTVRAVNENAGGKRLARLVFEHLGTKTGAILNAARLSGLRRLEELPQFHRNLLKPDQPLV